jgi:hypothetical protein
VQRSEGTLVEDEAHRYHTLYDKNDCDAARSKPTPSCRESFQDYRLGVIWNNKVQGEKKIKIAEGREDDGSSERIFTGRILAFETVGLRREGN